jgi:hypothetical protein
MTPTPVRRTMSLPDTCRYCAVAASMQTTTTQMPLFVANRIAKSKSDRNSMIATSASGPENVFLLF